MEHIEQKLVLVEYLYDTFGADSFEDFRDALGDVEPGFGADNRSRFGERLVTDLEPADWVLERLDEYDRNIAEYERRLDANRAERIQLKYYQYLSLLFTEVYLDRYFDAREALQAEFSGVVEDTRSRFDTDDLYPLSGDDLGKLAYWMATGSGKTLVMHANLWQFRRYADQDVENVLLITPNDGLTEQHLAEFDASGITAERFRPAQRSTTAPHVSVLDIHKLSEDTGEKTYAVDRFDGNNLVFVDEGHKGAQGDTWMQYREQVVGDEGFSFEYSATFGQALRSIDNEQLQNRYVKAILFDYSFRNFHADGFGKEYDILNLADDDATRRETYLTANLLAFYEQKRYFEENERALDPFNVEDPLWVFVGQTVNAVSGRALTKQDKVSDVEDIVRYLDRFLTDRAAILAEIDEILSASTFLDESGNRLFEDRFEYLDQLSLSPGEMYDDILRRLFNTTANAGLTLVRLHNTDGEIGLRVGRTGPYFGVISIGSTKRFVDRIEENTDIRTADQAFQGSLFSAIDDSDSDISVLIGAKKFAEGWDSYRVASMGLMRVGRNEGAEIIQIFGRGIRLRGKDNSLKRTSHLALPDTEVPDNIELLERLNVFGVKADYIEAFETQLEKENIPTEFVERSAPTDGGSDAADDALNPTSIQDTTAETTDPVEVLQPSEEYVPSVDLYPAVQTLRSQSPTGLSERKHTVSSEQLATSLVDWDSLFLDVLEYKRRRGYSSLILKKSVLREIIEADLFRLQCPESRLDGPNLVAEKEQTEEILTIVLRSYLDTVVSAELET